MKKVILILMVMLTTTLTFAKATKECKEAGESMITNSIMVSEQKTEKALNQFIESFEAFKNKCDDPDFNQSKREKFNIVVEQMNFRVIVGKLTFTKDSIEKSDLLAQLSPTQIEMLVAMKKVADKKKRVEREAEEYANRKNYDAWGLDLFIGNASSLSLSEEMDKLNNNYEYTLSGRCDVVDVTAFDGQYGIKCANRYKNLKATLYTTDRQKAISLRKGSSFMYEKLPISNFYTTKEIQVRDNVEYSRHTQHFENIERLSNEVVGIVELVY